MSFFFIKNSLTWGIMIGTYPERIYPQNDMMRRPRYKNFAYFWVVRQAH